MHVVVVFLLSSLTVFGKRTPAEFAKQMLQMPGVVSSLLPLAADTFEMAKTDDNFHIRCLTGFVAKGGGLHFRYCLPPVSALVRDEPVSGVLTMLLRQRRNRSIQRRSGR